MKGAMKTILLILIPTIILSQSFNDGSTYRLSGGSYYINGNIKARKYGNQINVLSNNTFLQINGNVIYSPDRNIEYRIFNGNLADRYGSRVAYIQGNRLYDNLGFVCNVNLDNVDIFILYLLHKNKL
jgi:hypothetical protein